VPTLRTQPLESEPHQALIRGRERPDHDGIGIPPSAIASALRLDMIG
jgi:hypothetical protein